MCSDPPRQPKPPLTPPRPPGPSKERSSRLSSPFVFGTLPVSGPGGKGGGGLSQPGFLMFRIFLGEIQSRPPRIQHGFRTIGREIHQHVVASPIAGPMRQRSAIGIAALGEIRPIDV